MNTLENGLFRVDLHVHTAFSYDGFATPEQLSRVCQRKGITGLAITDHNTIEGALHCQRHLPFPVIVGEEVSTRSGHLIGLFLKETIPPGLSMMETIARIRDQHGLVYLPHPFDRVRSSHIGDVELEQVAGLVDMVEVFNSRNLFAEANRQALALAQTRQSLQTVGSDAHSASEVGNSFVEMAPFSGAEEFLLNLRGGHLHGRKTSLGWRAIMKLRKRLRGIR
ncbi:MAG TPA: PHP-associated domain-containing protein [Candidatus Acidoferrum sp.]|nr:PHP-associated domain-containing protein [Candidatus Methylomirabilis sp.]HWU37986.1 PHP-associated domain-containing protein [Candidatus Acidoferrum sp.]